MCTNSLGLVFGVPETAFDALRAGELCRSNGAELFINLHQVERFCWVSGDDACPYTSNVNSISYL